MSNKVLKWNDDIKVTPSKILTEVSRECDINILTNKTQDDNPNALSYKTTIERLMLVFSEYPIMQGMSAVQIGILWRIAVLRIKKNEMIIVNPIILKSYGSQRSVESCSSTDTKPFKHTYYKVKRPLFGKVAWYDDKGEYHTKWYFKKLIRLWCHEIDHMDGKLISGVGSYWITLAIKKGGGKRID